MKIVARFALAFALLSIGCTDKTINNYNFSQFGGISGRVETPDQFARLQIPIMTVGGDHETFTDVDGFFFFANLDPGIYEIIIEPTGLSRRHLSGIVVTPGRISEVKSVVLSTHPYPIYQTRPKDGDMGVRTWNPAISLYADEQLDLDDLNAATTIEPSFDGEWEERSDSRTLNATYNFITNEDQLDMATTYHVSIASDVRTAAGTPLGTTMEFSFTTEELGAWVSYSPFNRQGRVRLLGFQAVINFNAPVSSTAVNDAISFIPDINGLWLSPDNLPQDEFFRFLDTTASALLPDTEYMLIVSDEYALTGDVHMPQPDTFRFTTESHGILFVSPGNGDSNFYPPGSIYVAFNIGMDPVSTESAFRLAELNGDPVPGKFTWTEENRRLVFRPLDDLTSGTVYWITLSTDAQTATGENLRTGWESYFRVR